MSFLILSKIQCATLHDTKSLCLYAAFKMIGVKTTPKNYFMYNTPPQWALCTKVLLKNEMSPIQIDLFGLYFLEKNNFIVS